MKDFRRYNFLQIETYGHGQMRVREEQRILSAVYLSPREEFQNKVQSQDRLKYINIIFGNKPVKFILLLEITDKDM